MTAKLENVRLEFAVRLNAALDLAGFPSGENGRQTALAKAMTALGHKVSQNGVRKWLIGESTPSIEKLPDLACIAQTTIDWLVTGVGISHKDNQLTNIVTMLQNLSVEQRKVIFEVGNAFALSTSPTTEKREMGEGQQVATSGKQIC
jgi:hypothetical protein